MRIKRCKCGCGRVLGKKRVLAKIKFWNEAHRVWWETIGKVAKKKKYLAKYYRTGPAFEKRKLPKNCLLTVKGGKWYWESDTGLSNGPFDKIGQARADAARAFWDND